MNDKDDIKDLFQRELGNYEAKVDPGLWQGVQSGLSGTASSASASLSLGAKVVIGVVSAAAITVASVMIYNASQEEIDKQINTKKEIVSSEITEAKSENTEQKNIQESYSDSLEKKDYDEVKSAVIDNKESVEDLDKENEPVIEKDVDVDPGFDESRSKSTTQQTDNTDINRNDQHDKTDHTTSNSTDDNKEKESKKSKNSTLLLQPEILSQSNQYVKFKVNHENIEEVVWDFGDGYLSTAEEPEHFYDEAGIYEVIVKGRNGDQEIEKQLTINVELQGEFINLPNAFSPNNDRNNDLMYVDSKGIKEFQITIMNKRQEVIFQSNDVDFKWDGTLNNGSPAPQGEYVYMIVAKDKQGNTINKYQRLRLER